MSDLKYRVGVDGVGEAQNALRTVKTAQDGVADGLRSNVGGAAQTAAQHLQGTASAVANLASRMGAPGIATGANLIGSIAGTTAQFASMGAVLGPGGALAGAITGFVAGIVGLATAQHDAAREARDHAEALGALERAARSAAREVADTQAGQFGSDTSDSDLTTRRDTAAAAARETQALVDRYHDASEATREANAWAIRQHETADAAADATLASIDEEIRRRMDLRATTQADAEARRVESERAAQEEARLTEIRRAAAEEDEAIASQHAIEDQRLAESAADRAATLAREQQMVDDLAGMYQRRATAAGIAAAISAETAEKEATLQEEAITREERRIVTDNASGQAAITAAQAETAALREKADAFHELDTAAEDAALAFGTGYVNSIDQVIASWHQLERVTRTSSRSMLADGRLLERGMVATGNQIAETVGGDMKSAFESALGAWLDGSVSFVEAAERMAKGVIKALVTESIVQAIVEGARAIAAIASQDYSGAATHAAAAAAWAAVGVVAGGIGAGIGAFGGAASGDAGGSTHSADANRERERDRAADRGPTTVNVYPGGFITARDVRNGVVQALNEANREGVRPDYAR